jgi:hypothetical protein
MKFYYEDYVAIRDLMNELQENEDPEDRLNPQEEKTLAKTNEIIRLMEKKRADEDAGLVPRMRTVFRGGRRVRIMVGDGKEVRADARL